MIEINGKTFRNLEDQVAYLSVALQEGKLIDELGIKVLGVYSTIAQAKAAIPGPYDYGDAFSIGTTKPYDLYVFTRNIEDFVDLGPFPGKGEDGKDGAQGPKGEKGEQGERGLRGERGFQGPQGIQGPMGPQGPIGPQGATGLKGDIGPAFNIQGTLASTSQLPTPTLALQQKGAAYIIPNTEGAKHIWVIQGATAAQLAWVDIGESGVQGPQGPAGKGIDTLTDIDLTLGDTTVQYDTEDGVTIISTGRASYQEGQTDFTTDLQLPIIAGDGISIDKAETAEQIIISNTGGLRVINIEAPEAATQGTLTAAQLAIVNENNPRDYILFNNEIYYLNDAGHQEGYAGYDHIGYENNKHFQKTITVTLSTGSWVLNVSEILDKTTADETYYKLLGSGNTVRIATTRTDGTQGSYPIGSTHNVIWYNPRSLPWYFNKTETINEPTGSSPDANGYLVTNTPLQDYHAANKKYVDEKFVDQVGIHTHFISVSWLNDGVTYRGSGIYIGTESEPFTLSALYDQRRTLYLYNTSLTGGLSTNILFELQTVGYSVTQTQGMASVNIYDLDNNTSIHKGAIIPTNFLDTIIQ